MGQIQVQNNVKDHMTYHHMKDDSEQQIEHTRLKHQKPRTNISPYLGITNYKTCV